MKKKFNGPNPRHHYVGEAEAKTERKVPDVGNAVGDRDSGYAATRERIVSDAGHRRTVDCAWDGHNAVVTRVKGYSDGLVRDRVTELGLHSRRCGQDQNGC